MSEEIGDPILIDRTWHFPSGETVPLVSGGSDMGDQEPGIEINFGPDGSEQASPDDLANPYLASIPEVDRNVVAKYIKGWQGNVTRRFQDIHNEYAPYKNLGDPEDLGRASALYNLMNESPQEIFRVLVENREEIPEIAQMLQQLTGQGQQQYQQGGEYQNPWADAGIPDDFANMFIQQQQVLSALAERVMGYDSRNQEQEEAAQLDSVLDDLHSNYGEFDEDAVLLRMYQGMDPDSAVQSWGESIQQAINSRQSAKPPPFVLGGNGSVPHGGVDPSKMGDKDRRSYIAQQLQAVIDNQ